MKTEVIIVGAGPTGLSLACQFVRHDVDFVIVEKNSGVTPFSKAVGVHARTLEIYEQLGLAQEAVAQGTIAGKVRLLEGGQVRGEMDLSNLGQGLSAYPFMLLLEQSKNEQLLYQYLQDHGKEVRWATELDSFSQSPEGVTAQIRGAEGALGMIEAKYLVGCDGARSSVRHSLGLRFEGSTFARLFYVADVQIDWRFSHDALHICLGRDSATAFFPLRGDNRYRIVGAFPEDTDKTEGEVLYEEIEARIKQDTKLELDIYNVNWFSTYKVHTRHVNNFSEGRCFVAGDAAHIHTPAGGQGMNTGIQDAYNLAWKLALVLKGDANARILESYNEERLKNAKNLLKTTDRMFNFGAGSDWLLSLIRTTVFPPLAKYILALDAVKSRFFPILSQIGINYREQSLSCDSDDEFAVKSGDRMPYFLLDGKSIYDLLHAPKFHLISFSDEQNEALKVEIEAESGIVVDFVTLPLSPPVAEAFGTDKPFFVLLRPDNYVAMLFRDNSVLPVRNYLREVIGFEGALSPDAA